MAEQDADNSGLAEGRMTLIGHLTELRNRLGVALGVFLVLFLVSVAPLPGTTSNSCLLYTSPSPRDGLLSRMPSSA